MKPRKRLQQKTELKRKTPLQRTELKRTGDSFNSGIRNSSGPVKRRKAVLPRHPGPQSPEERAGRDLLKQRSGGRCEVGVPGVCIGVGVVWSHRKRRSQSGKAEKWCVTNGLWGCGLCELHLTEFGATARVRSLGWTVHPSVDPARVPVWRRGQYVWLTPDGGFEPLDMTEIAEWIGGAA